MRKLYSTVFTTVMPFVFYYGFFYGNVYAANVSKFLIWACFLLSLLILIGWTLDSDKVEKDLKSKPRSYSLGYAAFTDVVGTLIIAASGHFWYAGLWLFQAFVEQILYASINKEK